MVLWLLERFCQDRVGRPVEDSFGAAVGFDLVVGGIVNRMAVVYPCKTEYCSVGVGMVV